jgi:two-component system cell cycle sensor histidine kinase/response regulator CckA
MVLKENGFSINLVEYMMNAVSVISFEADRKFIYVNPMWVKLTGYSPEEAYKMSSMELVHPDMRDVLAEKALTRMKGENEPEQYELKIITKDGRTAWADFFVTKIDYFGKPALLTVANDITDRKEAQAELIKVRNMLANAMNIAQLGHWEYDLKEDMFIFNDQFYSIFQTDIKKMGSYKMSPEQYADAFFFTEDKHIVRDEINKALHSNEQLYNRRLEHRIKKRSGQIGYISVHLFHEKDDKGNAIRMHGVNQDITIYKNIEIEAKSNEEKLRSVFRVAPTGIGVVVNRVFTEVNDTICQLTGYKKEELIGKSSRMMYPSKKEYDWVGEEKYKQISVKGTGSVETQWKTKTGKILDIVLSSTPIDINDLSKGLTFTVLDITSSKKAEKALGESEQLFRSLYENSTIGIYRTTPDGRILMANPAAVQMLGYKSFEELTKLNLEKTGYEPPYSREEFKDLLEKNDVIIGLESIWVGKNSKVVYVRESAKAVRDQNKKIIYYDGTFEDISASKEAEKKLQSSETRMRHLLNATTTIIYSMKDSGKKRKYIWVGDNIRQFGYNPKEVLEADWWINNIHPDDYKKTDTIINKIRTNNRIIVEYRFRHKQGHYLWVRDEMVFISDGKNSNKGEIIGSWIDISKRKSVEEALKKSEESYRLLVENLTDTIFSLDNKGIIRYISPAGQQIFGEYIENLINQPLRDFIYPEDLAEWDLKFKKVVSGTSGICDYRITTKTNEVRYVRCSYRPVYTKNHVTNITGILTDITIQKRNEEEIKKLSLAVEQSPSSVIITDINGNIEYVNKKLTELIGYSREELIGQNPRIFKSGHTPEHVYKELWSTILSGRTWHGEIKNKKKDGSLILEDIIISPMINDKGSITHFVGIREDVTKQRMLEEQLRQSQKMEAIGHLAGGVAHDFNNLLTVISGYSDLILRDLPKDHKHFDKLYQIKLSGQRAESLTRQLLAFSRKQIMKPVVLDINLLISEMEKMLKRIIGEDIVLMTIYDKDLLRVKADPGQIEQVILNLVVNSRDAMPNGGKLIIETKNIFLDNEYVSFHPEAKSGVYIIISVSDTGTGIRKDIQSQIFEPFFSTKEKGKGTGLGLSTVYGIVMQSGGYIDLQSEPYKMTTFNIYLPALEKNAKTIKEQGDLDIDRGKKDTILVVEDEASVRDFILAVLNKYNFNVLIAEDSKDAIKIAKNYNKQIHMLLTDVIMPGMSGKEISDKIIKILPKIKVVFMSGYTDDAIVHHGVLDESINFIQKPFTPQLLIKVLKEVLGQK